MVYVHTFFTYTNILSLLTRRAFSAYKLGWLTHKSLHILSMLRLHGIFDKAVLYGMFRPNIIKSTVQFAQLMKASLLMNADQFAITKP